MNFSVKLLEDTLADKEPEADPLSIDLLGAFQEAEELKKFALVFCLDSYACVDDLELYKSMFALSPIQAANDLNASILRRKLNCVAL